MKILAVCGSLQAKSGNLSLLNAAAASAPPGVEVVLFDGLRDLPHFNPDLEASGIPESVTRWRRSLAESAAVLIACPEYGFSLPGVLKNAIDWAIGSAELEGKVVAITAAVPAPERGRRGLQALRDTLYAVRATIVGGEPIPKGPGFEPQIAALLRALIDAAAPPRREADCILRPAVASEQKALEALQRRDGVARDRQPSRGRLLSDGRL
jgi:NAD(P)H-dependent FMN reductase